MPTTILRKRELIPGTTTELVLDAPHIARKAKPGNFVILRVHEKGERFPLTVADADPEAGTITIVYLVLGKSTWMLNQLGEGDQILDVCGPLGQATHIEKRGTVICIGGGTGIAAMHHIAKGHKKAGNRVIAVIGARTKDLLLFHPELSSFCDEVLVSTDDGSMGVKGFVTTVLNDYIDAGNPVDEIVAVGPVPMMQAVAELTRGYKIPTTVSLNSIMIDGIGMCGACRVSVGGEIRFACVDGPEFDGHLVDFQELRQRLCAYRDLEQCSYEDCKCQQAAKELDA